MVDGGSDKWSRGEKGKRRGTVLIESLVHARLHGVDICIWFLGPLLYMRRGEITSYMPLRFDTKQKFPGLYLNIGLHSYANCEK
jgi:hypothetical protein